jgi:NarL family two-component system response regulator LiaR
MISIALIDDHPMLTNAIGAWLCATGRFSIAGTAANLEEARVLMNGLDTMPQIVILDVSMGSGTQTSFQEDGLVFIPELKKICEKRKMPFPRVLVCSMYEDPFLVRKAMDLGAMAYVAKSVAAGEIIAAIDAILAGETYTSIKCQTQAQKGVLPALTRRENEIASLVKQFLSTAQIANRLKLSVRTVEKHLERIYEKTGVASRQELINL